MNVAKSSVDNACPPVPPTTPRHCHWTTLDCLEATWDKGPVPLGCEGPVCDLCAPSGASARWNGNVCLGSSVFVAVVVGWNVQDTRDHAVHWNKGNLKPKKITFSSFPLAAKRGLCTVVTASAAGRFLSMLSAQHTRCSCADGRLCAVQVWINTVRPQASFN